MTTFTDSTDRKPHGHRATGLEECGEDGCTGERLPATSWCLAYAAEQAPDALDAELKRISAEGTVDARGVEISAELLARILDALPRTDDRPTFTTARFDRASFQDRAWFVRASFQAATGLSRSRAYAVLRELRAEAPSGNGHAPAVGRDNAPSDPDVAAP